MRHNIGISVQPHFADFSFESSLAQMEQAKAENIFAIDHDAIGNVGCVMTVVNGEVVFEA